MFFSLKRIQKNGLKTKMNCTNNICGGKELKRGHSKKLLQMVYAVQFNLLPLEKVFCASGSFLQLFSVLSSQLQLEHWSTSF
jgi:hypothetical protein